MNLYNIPTHKNSPEYVNSVIEIPKGTNAKYEYDTELEMFVMDRCLISAMSYPANYGFIPKTHAEDGDPLDIIIFNNIPIDRGVLVRCKVVGALDMIDGGEKDYRIIGIPEYHSKCNEYNCYKDLDPLFLKVAANFFKHYKDLNGKAVTINSWLGASQARDIVRDSTID